MATTQINVTREVVTITPGDPDVVYIQTVGSGGGGGGSVADGGITTAKLAPGAVTSPKLATSITITNLTVSGSLSLPAGSVTLTMLSSAVQTSLGLAGTAVQPGGALGTPVSGTLTNCTGLPTAGLVNGAVTMAKLNQASATLGQIIMWNGTAWAPSSAYVDNAGLSSTLEAYVTSTALTTTLSEYATYTDLANALAAYVLPQLGASTGQVLTWSGTEWAPASPSGGGSGIANVVEDTTPQLGGQLDMNGQSILAGAATVTPTQLGYVSGVTSAIQTQLNNKSDTGHNHSGVYEPVMTAASQAEMEAGTSTSLRSMTPQRVAQAIAALAPGGGSGDVVGPASSTNNALVRFDGTTGKLVKDSGASLTNAGVLTASSVVGTGGVTGGDALTDSVELSADGKVIFGDGTNTLTLQTDTLTADHSVVLPNKSGTVAMTSDLWSEVVKTAETTRTTTTTLAADPDLVVPVGANKCVRIIASIFFDTTAAGDFKFGHTSPSGASVRLAREGVGGGGTALTGIQVDTADNTSGAAVVGSGVSGHVWFEAVINNGATAGNFTLTWAQNTSDAGNTKVLKGSYLRYKSD